MARTKEASIALPAILAMVLVLIVLPIRAADTLPTQISDAEYWRMISEFSEPDGFFQLEIITSNEASYQQVLPQLTKAIKPGGAYLGVGPEQNFTYIAAVQPKIAFLIDIRRDMMLEHLMYKAVFEMSADRADFVANLFSRKRPARLTADSSVEVLFDAFAAATADADLAEEHVKSILSRLKIIHGFDLTADDEKRIRSIYVTFLHEGVVNFYTSYMSPGYAGLMEMTDRAGKNWSFLVSKENYDRVRAMHQKNLIVPLVGDFAGPKAIRMAGQYVRDHDAAVNVFYLSNVEDYIQSVWPRYVQNVATLPIDASSTFIHWAPGAATWMTSMNDFIRSQRAR
jgi:hypothetical protein